MNDFLFTARGKSYLLNHYVKQGKSTHAIARERGTYANLVRRALLHHGIELRSKAEAQRQALESGRHTHPTEGKPRDQETKDRIGEGVSRAWGRLTPRQRRARVEKARRQWQAMPEAQREELHQQALAGLRYAALNGSKVERFLEDHLRRMGIGVYGRCETAGQEVDLLLPAYRTAIQVDGPGHHLPIWGQERLEKIMAEDAACTKALQRSGLTVVRVKNLVRNLSEIQKRNLLTELLSVLQSKQPGTRLVEMEVK